MTNLASPDPPALDPAVLWSMVRVSLDCIIVIDGDDRVLEFNPAAERTFGYARDDALGKELAALIVPSLARERHRVALRRYLQTGKPTILDRRVELLAMRADGSEFPVELTVTQISNQPVLFAASIRDLEPLRRAEEALHESEHRFRSLIEQLADYAIFMIDPSLRTTSWNEGVKRVLGYDEGDFIGREVIPAIFTPEDRESGVAAREFETAARFGRASDDRWMMRKDGSRFFALGVTVARRGADGQLQGFAKIMRDRTEHKQLEQDLRRTAEDLARVVGRQSDFLAVVSHELRNPLAPIRNGVGLLRFICRDQAEATKTIEMMDRQVTHLVRLVDDLLDSTRISRGKVQLRKENIDLNEVLRQALEETREQCIVKEHVLTTEFAKEPVRIEADPTRMVQIASNLLHNACKFTHRGGRVHLAVAQEDGSAVFRVRDSGVGIAPGQLKRIFGMFEQVESKAGEISGGLGIGLSLTKALVELHGGSIEAKSAGLDQGSEFVVRLPLAAPSSANS